MGPKQVRVFVYLKMDAGQPVSRRVKMCTHGSHTIETVTLSLNLS